MNKLISIMDRALSIFCISLSSFLVVCVVWQVFSRYVLNAPSTMTDEVARFLFIWVALMGAAYTLGQKRHLAIDLLDFKLEQKPRMRCKLHMLINVISFSFASVILSYGGGRLMLKTLSTGQVSPALGIEMGLVYAAIPLSGIFMILYLINDFKLNLAQLKTLPNSL
ncbi:TRAP transporter small permease [Alginatibacterium sediminis]|uniref:TRAP transporter small permease protein n=1 Tax=Alginatibacterium sediminis TaxID=2164068 RepID=A0A420EHA5_9ALTE|nr:TRAP transporter small permease [Alginatibacterium sediminis]RKF20063.1 TRAP transporter small permease [Alginatibacterium sediminis]